MNAYIVLLLQIAITVAGILLAQKYYPGSVLAAVAAMVIASALGGVMFRTMSGTPPGTISTPLAIGMFLAGLAPLVFLTREFGFLTAVGVSIAASVVSVLIRML